MPFTTNDWKDYPDTSTPITAAALEDLESRVTAYADTQAAYGISGYQALTSAVESVPRVLGAVSSALSLSSGVVRLAYFTAAQTVTASKVRSYVGSTAAGATPTLCRMGYYTIDGSGNLTLVARCASDTSLWAGSAGTEYERAFSTTGGYPSTYAFTQGTQYAAAVLIVTSFTAPSLQGISANSTTAGYSPRLTAALTGQTDLPGSISSGSLVTSGLVPYLAAVA